MKQKKENATGIKLELYNEIRDYLAKSLADPTEIKKELDDVDNSLLSRQLVAYQALKTMLCCFFYALSCQLVVEEKGIEVEEDVESNFMSMLDHFGEVSFLSIPYTLDNTTLKDFLKEVQK